MRISFLHTIAALSSIFLFPVVTSAAVTIEISQTSRFDVYGETTIFKPGNTTLSVTESEFKQSGLPKGTYSIGVSSPAGTSPITSLYIDGEIQEDKTGGRIAFELEDDQVAFLQVEHEYKRLGKVTVSSDPLGVQFTLDGPDDLQWKGVTPFDYDQLPEGQYNILFEELEGCGVQRKLSDKLINTGRVTFTMGYTCATADEMRLKTVVPSQENVTVRIDNQQVIFDDVGLQEWYSDYVNRVVQGGILAGYTNSTGELSGRFGPADTVNLAQLTKVAHKLVNLDESLARAPVQNTRAKDQWFEQYYASAEQQFWLAFIRKFDDPGRNATRGEVIGTLMQALEKDRIWPTGTVFKDVEAFGKYSASIELAAHDGIIDSEPELFRPEDPINRAELSKILTKVIEVYFAEGVN